MLVSTANLKAWRFYGSILGYTSLWCGRKRATQKGQHLHVFYFFVLFEPPHPVLDTDGNDTTNTLMTFFVRWRKYRGGEEDERIEGRGEKRMLLMLMLYY